MALSPVATQLHGRRVFCVNIASNDMRSRPWGVRSDRYLLCSDAASHKTLSRLPSPSGRQAARRGCDQHRKNGRRASRRAQRSPTVRVRARGNCLLNPDIHARESFLEQNEGGIRQSLRVTRANDSICCTSCAVRSCRPGNDSSGLMSVSAVCRSHVGQQGRCAELGFE